MLLTMLTGLFEQDDLALHPEDYRTLEGPDEDDEEQDDDLAVALRRRAARAAARGESIPLSEALSEPEGVAAVKPPDPRERPKHRSGSRHDGQTLRKMCFPRLVSLVVCKRFMSHRIFSKQAQFWAQLKWKKILSTIVPRSQQSTIV